MTSYFRAKRVTKLNRAVGTAVVSMLAGASPMGVVSMLANPTGEQVVSGDATFVREGNTLTITQTSQHAIINWQDFSIGSGNITQFLQNNANAAALNRVVSLNPSLIEGTLQATGRVILINPNGITVSSSGVIDTGSFIGSTLDVSNEQFLDGGALDFVGESSSSITNFGEITGDKGVFLFARRVDNAGAIVASGGQVGLATGSHILLQPTGDDDRVSVLVGTTSDITVDGEAIRNTGEVHAALVTLNATGSAYATAVNNEGIIRAQGFDTTGGRVLLTGGSTGTVLSSGVITAKNADGTGGHVAVTGDRVGLTGNAVVDVSGENGGGTALIGGSFQGQADASVQNASRTYVGADVQIKADALTSGDGGQVIVWADEVTRFYGDISAQGGSQSGNGGFVEVSGKQNLDFKGTVDTTAANGATGTLLLDPDDIVIQDQSVSPSTEDGEVADGAVNFADGTGTFNINELALEALAADTNIVLQATNTITIDDLTTDGAITLANNNIITLQTTTGAITFTNTDDSIVTSGTGFISILSGATASLGGLITGGGNITVTTTEGAITTSATQAIDAGSGIVALTAGTLTAQDHAITVNAGGIAGTGGVTLVADNIAIGGVIDSDASLTTLRQFENGTTINVGGADAAGVLGLDDAELDLITSTAAGGIQVGNTDSGDVTVTAAVTPAASANLRLTTGGAIAINDAVTVTGNLRLQSGTTTGQTVAGIITAAGLSTTGAGLVDLTTADNSVATLASSSTNDVSFNNTGALVIGSVGLINGVNLGANDLVVTTVNGGISQTQAITAGDATIVVGGANGINLNNVNNAIGGVFSADAADATSDLVLINNLAVQLGNVVVGDSASITSVTGAISQNAATTLAVGGDASFTATAADQAITLANTGNMLAGEIAFSTSGAGGDVSLVNTGDITLDTSTVGGDLTVVQEDAGAFIITQAGGSVLTVAGVASFDNDSTAVGDVSVTNTTATNFGSGDSTVSGDLTINSTGAVTQTGAVKVAGDFDATGAGSTTLDSAGNVFGGGFSTSDGSIVLSRVGDIDVNAELGGAVNTGAGNLTVIALLEGEEFAGGSDLGGNAIILNGNNALSGGLVVNTGDPVINTATALSNNITQSDNITVGGTATFRAVDDAVSLVGTGNIVLNAGGTNTLSGAVQFTGNNVSLTNSVATNLGSAVVAGAYAIVSNNGAITNSGVLDVSGVSSFSSTGANAITLGQNNLLDGAVSVSHTGTGAVALNNAQATVLGAVSTNGGNITVTSAGAITQTGAITQATGGSLNLTTTVGGIDLSSVANAILTLNNVTSAGDFRFYEADGYNVAGTVAVTGFAEFGVESGNVVQTGGTLSSNGLLLSQTNAGAVSSAFTFSQAGNAFGTLASQQANAASESDITVVNNGDITIGTVNAVSGLSVGVGSVSITSSTGAIIRGGVSTIAMGGGVLTLNSSTGTGLVGTPVLTSGSHTLTGTTSTSGGFFVQNTGSGDVTVGAVSAPGAVSIENTVGNIGTTGAVTSGTSTVDLNASGGSLTIGNTVDAQTTATLLANQAVAINNLVEGANVVVSSGTTLAQGANIGTAGTTATVSITNGGAFTRTAGTVNGGTSVTLNGGGAVGALGAAIQTNAPAIILAKSGGDTFVTNAVGASIEGALGGGADLRFVTSAGNISIGAGNLAATGLGSIFEFNAASQIDGAGGFIDLNGGDLSLVAAQTVGNGVPLQLRNVGTLAASSSLGAVDVNSDYTALFGPTGNNLTIGSVTGLGGVAVHGISAVGAVTVNQSASNSLTVADTTNLNDVISSSANVSLVIAQSGSGADQLFVQAGSRIQTGAGAGGTITIRGGTNNQGVLAAGLGTTILLDGGRPDLVLGGAQTYTGSVVFEAAGDLIVTGIITQTGSNATTSFIADSDNNGTGGFILTDSVDANAGIFNTVGGTLSLVSIEGSNLITTAFDAELAAAVGGSIGNGVVIDKAGAGTAISNTNNGDISIEAKDPTAGSQNSVIIAGTLAAAGAADGDIIITSDFGGVMASNITAGNNVSLINDGIFIRQDGTTAKISAGGDFITQGIGDLGTDVVTVGALNGFDSAGDLLSNAAAINFDSSGTSKIGSSAFITEDNNVAIEGALDFLRLTTTAGAINEGSNNLNIGAVQFFVGGAVNLGSLAHEIDEFETIVANGSITYTGATDLLVSGLVRSISSGTITLDLSGFDFVQDNAGADIRANNIILTFDEAILRANLEGVGSSGGGFVPQRAANITINNTGLLVRDGDTSLVRANNLFLNDSGSIGNDLSDGLRTRVANLTIDKPEGDVFVIQPNTAAEVAGTTVDTISNIQIQANIGASSAATMNVASDINSLRITGTGINASNGSNVHLISRATTGTTTITTDGAAIAMSGGELLLVGRGGVGTKAAPIITTGSFTLAALNEGTAGGIYVENGAGDGQDVTIGDITAFTPDDQDDTNAGINNVFNGVVQASTGNTNASTGQRNIRIVNVDGDILIGDRIQTTLNNQQVILVANGTGGAIRQADADGVINMSNTVGTGGVSAQLYLQADAGIGEVDNAILTNGTFVVAANSSNDGGTNTGGIYLTNVGTADQANALSAGGTVTIGAVSEAGGGFATINGVTTDSSGADADIRIRNIGAAGSNIVVNDLLEASVGIGGNTIALIADNGALSQGVSGRVVSDTDGVNPGEVLLAASQGIGTLATAFVVEGHYNLSVRNDTLAFTTGAVTGNINVLNNAVGAISGLGDITITDVADLFAGAGVNAGILPLIGGSNSADLAGSGAIRITNTNVGLGVGDILLVNTSVVTTGATNGDSFIELNAADDVVIGSELQASDSIVETVNGAISITAANASTIAADADNADGVAISGSAAFDTRITAGGNDNGIVTITSTGARGDILVVGATVEATGDIVGNAIVFDSDDDIVIGSDTQLASSVVETVNGGISLTAANNTSIDSDGVGGILLQAGSGADANNDALVTAQGVNGAVTLTATENRGTLTVNGGGSVDAVAVVSSAELMTVDAHRIFLTAGDFNRADAILVSANGQDIQATNDGGPATDDVIVLQGGNAGNNSSAEIINQGGNQIITADLGNIALLGGDGRNANAIILSETDAVDQTITVTDGDIRLVGGTDGVNAGDASILLTSATAGTQEVSVAGAAAGTLLMQGGTGVNGRARIDSVNDQVITVADTMSVLGGTGVDSSARVVADGRQEITVATGDLVITGGSSIDANAAIVANGNDGVGPDEEAQRIIVQSGNLLLSANAADNSGNASIDSNGIGQTQFIQVGTDAVDTGYLFMTGGGENTTAGISSDGAQTITLAGGALAAPDLIALGLSDSFAGYTYGGTLALGMIGGAGTNSLATISAALDQSITATTGDVQIVGGRGESSAALIAGNGLLQDITVADGSLLVQGNQNADGTIGGTVFLLPIAAGIAATNDAAVQTVSVTDGNLVLLGGAEEEEVATIANIGTTGRQTVTVTGGDLNILAGAGADADADLVGGLAAAAIVGGGLNDTFNPVDGSGAAQLIVVDGGNLNIIGGANVDAQGNIAGIANINEGESTQYVDVSGVITLTGGEGELAAAGIIALGFNNTIDAGISQNVIAGSGLDLNGGSGPGAIAGIASIGILGEQIIQVTENDLTMNGGTGDSAAAVIVSTYTQDVTVTDGDLIIEGGDGFSAAAVMIAQNAQTVTVTSGDLTIRGGLGESAGAGIQMENVDADLAQTVTVTDGDVLIEGGAGLDSRAGIAASLGTDTNATQSLIVSNGTLTINGGDGEAAEAGVEHGGSGQQLVEVSSGIAITGGSGLTAQAGIEATRNGNQVVTVTGLGDLTLTGGEGEDADALILQGADGNQTTTVTQGNLLVQADQSATANGNSDGYIQSNFLTGTQDIDVSGTITVLGGQNGTGTNETAFISGAGDQFITAGTGLSITGGDQLGNTAAIVKGGNAALRQEIIVSTGDLEVFGGAGEDAHASISSNGSDAAVGQEGQRIVVLDGNMLVQASATVDAGNAIIESITADQTQVVLVQDDLAAAGNLSVVGGAAGTIAGLTSAGDQIITADNEIDITATLASSDVDVTAAGQQDIEAIAGSIDVLASNNATVTIQNTLGAQNLTAGADITVDASSGSVVLVQADEGVQTIEAANLIDVTATNTGTVVTINSANGTQDIDAVAASIALDASDLATINVTSSGTQTIDAQTFIDIAANNAVILVQSTTADQTITAETGDITIDGVANADVDVLAATTQEIDATDGSIALTANASTITVQNTAGAQTITAGTDATDVDSNITVNATNGAAVTIEALNGTQTITAQGLISLTGTNGSDIIVNSEAQNQLITAVTGDVTLDAASGADIQVTAETTQAIEASAGDIVVTATNANIDVLADTGAQTILANGNIDVDASTGTVTIDATANTQTITAETGDITIDAINGSTVEITAAQTQDIDATLGSIEIQATSATVLVQNTTGAQTITAGTDATDVDSNITVNATNGAAVTIEALNGTHTITAQGLISLTGTNSADIIVNSEAQNQLITAVTGDITLDAADGTDIQVTANTTQNITATAGDIIIDATNANIDVLADTGAQTILANGNIDVDALNSTVTIDAVANTQTITAEIGDITVDAINGSTVEITAAQTQDIDATLGSIEIQATSATVLVQNTTGAQTITAGTDATDVDSNITVDATNGAAVTIEALNGTQTITAQGLISLTGTNGSDIIVNSEAQNQLITAVTGDITLDAVDGADIQVTANTTQNITATAGDIIIDATNANIDVLADTGAQTILANGSIDVDASNSTITIDATASTQDITATTGNITIGALAASTVELFAATEQTITAGTGIDIDAAAISTVDVFAGTTQDITATTGNIAITTTDTGTAVNILALSDQTINVADAAGDLSIIATTGSDVFIGTLASQTITVGNDMLITASDAGTSVEIGSGTTQDIDIGNDLALDASSAAGIALLGGTDQAITVAENITIDAVTGSLVEVLAAATQDIEATNGTIAITANASTVTVQNTAGTQDITAGTNITVDALAASTVLVQSDAGLQTITANGLIDLSADASDITINSETDAQAITATTGTVTLDADNASNILVTASTTQGITATAGDILIDANASNIEVLADTGAQTILANGDIDVIATGSTVDIEATLGTQGITATTGDITIDSLAASAVEVIAGGAQAIGATAGSISLGADGSTLTVQNNAGAQTITAGTDITVEALAGATLLVQADAGLQTVTAAGLIDIDGAAGSLLTINSDTDAQVITATAGAITVDAINTAQVFITADGDQDIVATAAGIVLGADNATIRIQTANGNQGLITGTDLTADSTGGALIQVQADTGDQTVDVGGLIDLSADNADMILAATTGSQTITSVGVTNLTGINGGSTLVTAIDSTLNNAGGVLTGNAVIGTSGVTELVTINNSGALTLADVDAAHVHVNADAGAATVTFQGVGTVGAIADGERLVTNTAILDFADATKTVILDERVGDVGIEGVVGNLDLVLTDALGGNITDSADFTALIATLETTDGDITLGANTVIVDEFSGLVANNGSIDLSLDGNTILGNRADGSLDAGVFADGDITVVTTGSTTVTADLVLSTAGDIAFTATSLVLNAENATPNTQLNGLSGPTGAVGTIQTNDGTQTYNAPVVLLSNTRISATDAGNGSDAVVFNGTINGPGGLEIGSTPVFNAFIGDTTPLAYLILNSDSVFNAASGDPALGSASVNLAGSFINNGTMTLGNPVGGVNQNFTFVVDSGTAALSGSVFQGGLLNNHISQDAVNGSFITVFGADLNSVSFDNIPLGTQQFGFYTFNPGFAYNDPLSVFTPGFIYYKAEQLVEFENLRERLEREDGEKDTSLAYDGSVVPEGIAQLAGSEQTSEGSAGGVATSTYDIVQPGEVETVRQVVFSNVVIIP